MKRTITVLATLVGLVVAGHGAPAKLLSLGDPAPPLKVGGWAKGVPVKGFEPGKVYVLDFWATWCGPCKLSIPHLSALRRKYDQVTFAGVSVWEKGSDVPQKIKSYVANEGDKMYYKVAFDTPEGTMAKTWMEAAGQPGVPTTFIVQDEKIVWIGDPMKGLDETLSQISAGTYDLAKAKADADAKAAAAAAGAAADEQSAKQAFDQAVEAKDYAKGLNILNSFIQKHPDQEASLAHTKVRVMLLTDKTQALAYADVQGAKTPAVFVDVAIMLLHDNPPIKADPSVALDYAKKADAGFEGKQPYVKVILAQAYKVNGQLESADATFKAGVDLAKSQGEPQDAIDQLTKLYRDTK